MLKARIICWRRVGIQQRVDEGDFARTTSVREERIDIDPENHVLLGEKLQNLAENFGELGVEFSGGTRKSGRRQEAVHGMRGDRDLNPRNAGVLERLVDVLHGGEKLRGIGSCVGEILVADGDGGYLGGGVIWLDVGLHPLVGGCGVVGDGGDVGVRDADYLRALNSFLCSHLSFSKKTSSYCFFEKKYLIYL